MREKEREHVRASVCVCGEKRAWELTQQASEESEVQEKSRMADAGAGERCKLPRVEEQDGQFSIDVTFPAKA